MGRDDKIDRGTSYPSLNEMEQAENLNAEPDERQGVSHLPGKDLGGANPPTGSSQRQEKFAVEDETAHFKTKDDVEPTTAAKFLGLSSAAAEGATLPAAALMTNSRDAKSGSAGETRFSDAAAPMIHNDPRASSGPSIPVHRPAPKFATAPSPEGVEKSQDSQPSAPPRPHKGVSEETKAAPHIPARPSDKSQPVVPRRPASSSSTRDLPQIPARPTKTNSMPKDAEDKPATAAKPGIPGRPVPGKLAGSSKFAFASALEAKLKVGPAPLKKKEIDIPDAPAAEEASKPLTDARKGRAKGPQKRKPPTTATAVVDEGPADSKSVDDKLSRALGSPICEKGEIFTSRFGVEMRSMSVQTGVIKISSPTGRMTILEGAGTDYVGQTVVVNSQAANPEAMPEPAEETVLDPA